jgi:hypothetical protein
MTDMHREGFDLWRASQPCRETPFPYDIAWLSWCAALHYRDEQEKQI